MSLGDATQKIIGDTVQTVAEQANNIVQSSSTQAAYDKALTLGEQIANYTCKELKDQIPPMITSTTNEIIKQLTAKIDSEKFTTDFINVLQKNSAIDMFHENPIFIIDPYGRAVMYFDPGTDPKKILKDLKVLI